MHKLSIFAILLLVLSISGCDHIDNILGGGPPIYHPLPAYHAQAPYQIFGEVKVFYTGPIPLNFGADPSITSANNAIGAEIQVSEVLQGTEIAIGDTIIVSWATDAAPPEAPCFEWEVGDGIGLNSLVEVKNTGNFCTSYIMPMLLD